MNRMDIQTPHILQKRMEELEEEEQKLEDAVKDAESTLAFAILNKNVIDEATEAVKEATDALKEWMVSEEKEEFEELLRVKEEMGSSWDNDEPLISDNDWVEYVEEMVKDMGDLPHNIPHYIVIDWDATADNIRQDYSEVDLQGGTYYYRNV